jgi:hypothetical protein
VTLPVMVTSSIRHQANDTCLLCPSCVYREQERSKYRAVRVEPSRVRKASGTGEIARRHTVTGDDWR